MKKLINKAWCALAVTLLASTSLQAQTPVPMTASTNQPSIGLADQSYLPGPVVENVTAMADDGLSYIAGDRQSLGQSFTTGSNPAGYSINSVVARQIIMSSGGTWATINNGQSFQFRFGSISGTTLTPIVTTTALFAGDNIKSEGSVGTGKYFTFDLTGQAIGTLSPNTTYFFELATSQNPPFFEWHNTTNATSDVGYAGGSALHGDTLHALDADGVVALLDGDFAFVAKLSPLGGPSIAVAVSPASAYRSHSFTVTATTTPGSGTVTNATVDLSAIGGSATAGLVLSTANVFTNTFTVSPTAPLGAVSLQVTAWDTVPVYGLGSATFTVSPRPPTNAIVVATISGATSVADYTEASFHFAATNDAPLDAGFPMAYSWYTNSVLVSSNMGPNYTFLTTPADTGMTIYAIARVADTNFSSLTVTSGVLTLTVNPGALVYTNGIKQEFFAGASRADVEIGNVARGVVREISAAESTGGFGNNHSRRYSGFFIPQASDYYVFFVASDDDCDVFLSLDSNPANKQLIAQETEWNGTLGWLNVAGTGSGANSITSQRRSDQWTNSVGTAPYTAGFYLQAGEKYYLESVMHNGSGGDNWAITYQTIAEIADPNWSVNFTNGAPSRLVAESNNIAIITFPGSTLAWVTQPLANVSVYEGQSTNFISLATSDADLSLNYQWYVGTTPVGGNAATLTLNAIPFSYNNGQIKVVASTVYGGLSITSSVCTLQVISAVFEPGWVAEKKWINQWVGMAVVDGGTAPAPTFTCAVPGFEAGLDNPGSQGQDNTIQMIGVFVAPTSGDYVFFITSHDDGELFLSTDDTPAHKRLIALEQGWSNNWEWNSAGGAGSTVANKRSDSFIPTGSNTPPYSAGIPLVAGQHYYMEVIHDTSRWGNEQVGVTYRVMESGYVTAPDNGTYPNCFGTNVGMSAVRCQYVAYTQQPTNVTVAPMSYATFAADGTTDSQYPVLGAYGCTITAPTEKLFYQWYKGSTAIPGATSKTLTVGPLLPSDTGAQFHCAMRALGYAQLVGANLIPAWSNSASATLTVQSPAVFETGVAIITRWTNSTKALVESGAAGQSSYSYTTPKFEGPISNTGQRGYASAIDGYFIPAVTGSYIFFVNSDGASDLFVSTDSSPANKVLIAQETGWSDPFRWVSIGATWGGGGTSVASQKRSDSYSPDTGITFPGNPTGTGIPMTGGQKYFIQAIAEAGGGDDEIQVTYKMYGDADPVDGTDSLLTGSLIGTYVPRIPWVAFLQQPTPNQTVTSGTPVTFTVVGTNAPSVWVGTTGNPLDWLANPKTDSTMYQWLLNGSIIPGATSASYTRDVLPSDAGKQFVCQLRALGYADNAGTRIWSNSLPAVLTVVTDAVPPTISYAVAFQNTNQASAPYIVDVTFSKGMNATSLSNATYTINGVTVTNKSVSSNKRTVQLTLDVMPALPLTITVTGVTDLSGNALVANTAAINAEKLTFTDVGTPGVNPLSPSIVWVTGDGGYVITAQGNDIWDAADAFNFGWEMKTNDFDVAVRGVSIGNGVNNWSKMGLMVREDLTAASRHWALFDEPTTGANRIDSGMRTTNGANATTTGWQIGNLPAPSYPNAWLRLTRTGAVLNGYYSTDGANWVQAASYDTTATPLPLEVYVGIATTSHQNGTYNTAEYANYGSPLVFTRLTISLSGTDVIVSWTPAGGHLEASPAISGPAVDWQPVGGGNPATIPVGAGERFFRVVTP